MFRGIMSAQFPSIDALSAAAKIAIEKDKPIMMDYWVPVSLGTAYIGIRTESNGTTTKLLIKSSEEYTSTIVKMLKVAGSALIETENSIYVVSDTVRGRAVNLNID